MDFWIPYEPEMESTLNISHGMSFDRLPEEGESVLTCYDDLVFGPCAAEPLIHAQTRRHYWRSVEAALRPQSVEGSVFSSTELISAVSADTARRVILWTNRSLSGRLFVWWALEALDNMLRNRSIKLKVAYMGRPLPSALQQRRSATTIASALTVAMRASAHASRLWRSFALGDFGQLTTDATSVHPRDRLLIGPQVTRRRIAMLFPRRIGRRIFLSEVDSRLLSLFAEQDWKRPIDVIKLMMTRLPQVPPENLLLRLDQWASPRDVAPFLEKMVDGSSKLRWSRAVYRLTSSGHDALRSGIPSLASAPPLFVGGATAYAPKESWIVVAAAGEFCWYKGS